MKTVIECTLGATEQTVGGITYSFDRDDHGRFVNEVNSVLHRSIFLNVVHYREVPLDPPKDEEQEIPAFLSGQGSAADDDDSKTEGNEQAVNGDEQTGGEQGTGEENASGAADAPAGDAEADKPADEAPVIPAKKATSKSR